MIQIFFTHLPPHPLIQSKDESLTIKKKALKNTLKSSQKHQQ